jgi:two-component system sensor histidine kinase VicK
MQDLENSIFKKMTEQSDEVFFIYKPDEKRFVYASPAFEQISRRHIADLFTNPKALLKIIHKEDVKYVKYSLRQLLKKTSSSLLDFRIIRSDDTERSIRLKVYPILDDGKIRYLSGILEDDSARKMSISNMQKVNGWKDSMLEILAHDLRGPIGIVKMLSSAIAAKLPKSENKQIHEWIGMIQQIANQNIDLIHHLIKKESLETAAVVTNKSRLDVVREVKGVMNIYIHSQHQTKKTFKFTSSHTTTYAMVDSMKFLQIINNLVSNAIKFTHEDGDIRVHVEKLDTTFLVTVSDDGIGIPKDLQSIIFNKYTDAGRTSVDGQESVGLGLWIVRSFTEAHAGRIWFETGKNKRTKFYVEIPLCLEKAES